jgi:hypothetical protein
MKRKPNKYDLELNMLIQKGVLKKKNDISKKYKIAPTITEVESINELDAFVKSEEVDYFRVFITDKLRDFLNETIKC